MAYKIKILILLFLPLFGAGQQHMMSVLAAQQAVNTGVPTYESSSTLTASATGVSAGGTFTIACPATVNQYDILIAVVQTVTSSSGSITEPSGWTNISTTNSGLHAKTICWKLATGAEDGTNITFTTSTEITSANGYSGVVYRFSGSHYTTPYTGFVTGSIASVNWLSIPEITTTSPQMAVVVYVQKDDVAITTDTGSYAEWTKQDDQSTTTGIDYRHAIFTTTTTGTLAQWYIKTSTSEYASYYQFLLNQ